MFKKRNTFYSLYLNIISILLCVFSIIITLKTDDTKMFTVCVILLVLISIEFISNVIQFIKIYKQNRLTKKLK
jgi:hypothetical protein